MDANRISEQEKRENLDPREQAMPVPVWLIILVVCTVMFGVGYIVFDEQPLPSAFGDQRTLADLTPKKVVSVSEKVDGAAVYAARCAACHQATGAGLPGVFPPLAGSEWVTGKEDVLAKILLHGVTGALTVKGAKFSGAMPAFKEQLKDDEIAALATYMRAQWGNQAAPVAAEVIAKARTETASRTTPFNGDADLEALK